jgi:hypothetical protein
MASSITKFRFQSPSNRTVESAQRKGTAKHSRNTGFAKLFIFIVFLVDCRLLSAVMKTMIAF